MWLFQAGWRKAGMGALGCAGLGHCSLALLVRHTAMMNFAVWFEVVAGVALLAVALGALVSEVRNRSRCDLRAA